MPLLFIYYLLIDHFETPYLACYRLMLLFTMVLALLLNTAISAANITSTLQKESP